MGKVKSPLVSVIVVNWNGGDVFEECLKSLSRIEYKNLELIVVDNGSWDGSDSLPGKYFKKARVIRNETNVGFALANNQGVKKANGEYILLLNNDTRVEDNFLTMMVLRMQKDSSIGVIQPKIKMIDNPKHLDNCGSYLTRSGFLYHWGFGEIDSVLYGQERQIYTAKGACLLTRRSVVEKIELFDDKFVSYFEESDFCGRVWLSGWKVLYYPEAVIYHKIGFTSKKLSQVDINYHSFKNRIASYIKNFSSYGLITILLPHLLILIGLAFFYLLKLNFQKFLMIPKAMVWNLVNLEKLLEKRKSIQENRKLLDKEIISRLMVGWKLSEMIKHFFAIEKNF